MCYGVATHTKRISERYCEGIVFLLLLDLRDCYLLVTTSIVDPDIHRRQILVAHWHAIFSIWVGIGTELAGISVIEIHGHAFNSLMFSICIFVSVGFVEYIEVCVCSFDMQKFI
ncbi:Uncharacterized protein Fot_22268 [Forsythia ovata]|uniref:NADH dehydrogenase subunit 4 n=1 Tax=Forsythia ovata TaxID=205694 RepID=A0ABD1UX93_9LAMI